MIKEKCQQKIKTHDELLRCIGPYPRKKPVALCHGTFDIVHPGHIRHLCYVKEKAAILVASVTSDAHIQKANFRPFVPQQLRAWNLAALEAVDYVIIDDEATPLNTIQKVKPDYFAKGYEYVQSGLPIKTAQEQAVVEEYGGKMLFTPGDVVYSSSALIESAPPNLAIEKLQILLESEGLSFATVQETLHRIKGKRIHIVGDTIVDSYTYTSMIGGQTKTPTLSLRFQRRKDYIGGAAIVAKHLRAAGAQVVFTTVIGDDENGQYVVNDLKASGIAVQAIIDKERPTTNKNVFICQQHRIAKVDTLDNRLISGKIVSQIRELLRNTPSDGVVLSDFRHGIFSPETIASLCSAIPSGVFRAADSQVASRWGNILDFQGFDLITPNEREARFALGDQDSVVRPLALKIYLEAKCRHLILKLGERGILSYRPGSVADDVRSFFVVDSLAQQVKDPVGAGDALLAYATLALMTNDNAIIAGILGSLAAGIACDREGNQAIDQNAIIERMQQLQHRGEYAGSIL